MSNWTYRGVPVPSGYPITDKLAVWADGVDAALSTQPKQEAPCWRFGTASGSYYRQIPGKPLEIYSKFERRWVSSISSDLDTLIKSDGVKEITISDVPPELL